MVRTTILALAGSLAIVPAIALEFPETCVTPPATVTRIAGINTRNARMEARYTLPDIIQACHRTSISRMLHRKFALRVIDTCYRHLLHANADCVAGVVTVEGLKSRLPVHADCASGGFRAIKAFRTLCPSYGGKIEIKD